MCLFLKGGQVYPVPHSMNFWRPCCCLDPPLLVFGGDVLLFSWE